MSIDSYNRQLQQQREYANAMRQTLIRSQFDDCSNYIADPEMRNASIAEAVAADPIYASMGEHGLTTAMIHIQAINEFSEKNDGRLPSDMLLASARQELENLYVDSGVSTNKDMMLAAVQAGTTTSQGIPTVVTTAQVALPRLLASQTLDVVTYISGKRTSELEYFEIETVAGSDFGDYKKGDLIGALDGGQYSNMVQHFAFPDKANGTVTTFSFDSALDTPAKKMLPIAKGSVVLYINKDRVGVEAEAGKLYGTYVQGGTPLTVTATIDHKSGKVVVETSGAPLVAGTILELEIQIDIEAEPNLIPEIAQQVTSFKINPALRILRSSQSLQSLWKMRSDLNVDARALNLTTLRDHLAAQDDLHVIKNLSWLAKREAIINCAPKAGSNDNTMEGFELVRTQLTAVSDDMMSISQESGLVGLYCTREASAFFKNTPSFKQATGYQQLNSIHFVGIAFNRYKIYEVPQDIPELAPGEALGYGKSNVEGRAPWLKGDIEPPMQIDHQISQGLVKSDTTAARGYNTINPKHGQNLIYKLKFINQ
ncbi:hypothetical protein [Vibrio sonorensis]|uniref:hypothetical protein n=1 Tax=Vibrio sonorensis TaxID=1004316 RepID=UPI0008D99EC2|nr:hypothetical protein [Vibrio sonorensis]